MEWIRKAKAELEAEAAAAKARQRQQEAEQAEGEAAETEALGDTGASKRAARRARGARKRAEDAQKLALEKAGGACLAPPITITGGADPDPLAMPCRQLPTDAAGNPRPQAQPNITDPDSHMFKVNDGWIQGYNCQAAVDADHQVIVAIGVSNQASDAVHLLPMLERTLANTGRLPDTLTADAGYCSTANLEACEHDGLDAYISTNQQQHGKRQRPSRGRPPRDLDARGRMDRKLRSVAGQAIYAMRKTVVEPVFGQTKSVRGLDRFLLRGQDGVNGEWSLMATTHNILKLFRASLAVS